MCNGIICQWHCGHQLLKWKKFCLDGNRKEHIPCTRATSDDSAKGKARTRGCCSTQCCQIDLHRKVEAVLQIERRYGILPGRPWSERSIEYSNKDREGVDRVALSMERKRMVDATGEHFRFFVALSAKRVSMNNSIRLQNSQKPVWPLELTIPDRPEISESDRAHLSLILQNWKESLFVMEEKERYENWLSKQSYEQKRSEEQWEQEMKWQRSNSQVVRDYAQSEALSVYQPIIPAGENPRVLAPGTLGSQYPPRTEKDYQRSRIPNIEVERAIFSPSSPEMSSRLSSPSPNRSEDNDGCSPGASFRRTKLASHRKRYRKPRRKRVEEADQGLSSASMVIPDDPLDESDLNLMSQLLEFNRTHGGSRRD